MAGRLVTIEDGTVSSLAMRKRGRWSEVSETAPDNTLATKLAPESSLPRNGGGFAVAMSCRRDAPSAALARATYGLQPDSRHSSRRR
jgi:hypothetical protein